MQGEMKLQIDRMIAKFFSSLPVDEQLNFSVAVTIMSVQRKWRQRMKAHKVTPPSWLHCRPGPFLGLDYWHADCLTPAKMALCQMLLMRQQAETTAEGAGHLLHCEQTSHSLPWDYAKPGHGLGIHLLSRGLSRSLKLPHSHHHWDLTTKTKLHPMTTLYCVDTVADQVLCKPMTSSAVLS